MATATNRRQHVRATCSDYGRLNRFNGSAANDQAGIPSHHAIPNSSSVRVSQVGGTQQLAGEALLEGGVNSFDR
jgi:hypothetical protein